MSKSKFIKSAPAARYKNYAKMKENARQRNAEASLTGRDIAPLPEVKEPERRSAAEGNFRLFLETYFPKAFYLNWSADHLKFISRLETVIFNGGRFAIAMPRGRGKTTICERAAIWALLYGYRKYVVLIGANEKMADKLANSIKSELQYNELLQADFPEVCYPIAKLENIALRAKGQLCGGKPTAIQWGSNRLVLPNIAGSKAAESVIETAGITGQMRGLSYTKTTGEVIRPDVVLIDDPQTKESARSLEQTNTRLEIVKADILGLAGVGKQIAALMPCTVIEPNDLADQLLDRTKNPDWQGERFKALYQDPANLKLWEDYREIWAASMQNSGEYSAATEFYRAHQKAMDKGAKVAWQEAIVPPDISALQSIMNARIKDEASFQSEMQNTPVTAVEDNEQLNLYDVIKRCNRLKRYAVPTEAEKITAFIDVQQKVLFYVVTAWAETGTGYVIDYGSYPDQQTAYFTLQTLRRTLANEFPAAGLEGCLFQGLENLTELILGKTYSRADGADMHVSRCLIDAAWGYSTETIHQFAKQSKFASIIYPSYGVGIGAKNTPISQYQKRAGERIGHNWLISFKDPKHRATRYVRYDANFWKSYIAARFRQTVGDKGALTLYGDNPQRHLMYGEHITAEYFTPTAGRGRRVEEWRLKPSANDNHFFDCTVGTAVAASIEGISAGSPVVIQNKTAAENPPPQQNAFVKPVQKKSAGDLFSGGKRIF